ncbi:MAG: hypothetical protein QOE29_2176 [Gaiellaceae bacterium]|jgi:uncharacterized SAM-binding protein YcdF (DUF218 family)|nr:hypothetical protein [Gaiellaceae bacterium]
MRRMLSLLRPTRLIPILFVLWFIGVWYLLLHPKSDKPAKADVVMVLAGDARYRLPTAMRLMRRHVATTLIISDGRNSNSALARKLCDNSPPAFHTLCFRPEPYSTRGEAQTFARLAAQNHWTSVAVVSSPTHLTRLRILFGRCFHGTLYAVRSAQSKLSKLESVFFETGKLAVETTLVRSC